MMSVLLCKYFLVFLSLLNQERILSISKPEVRIRMEKNWIDRIPEKVTVNIKEVTNPNEIPVSVKLFFASGEKTWDLTVLTLYPSDKPGVFVYRADIVLRQMISDLKNTRDSTVYFCLKLETNRGVSDKTFQLILAEPLWE